MKWRLQSYDLDFEVVGATPHIAAGFGGMFLNIINLVSGLSNL